MSRGLQGTGAPLGRITTKKCPPCPRTPVHHVSGPYTPPKSMGSAVARIYGRAERWLNRGGVSHFSAMNGHSGRFGSGTLAAGDDAQPLVACFLGEFQPPVVGGGIVERPVVGAGGVVGRAKRDPRQASAACVRSRSAGHWLTASSASACSWPPSRSHSASMYSVFDGSKRKVTGGGVSRGTLKTRGMSHALGSPSGPTARRCGGERRSRRLASNGACRADSGCRYAGRNRPAGKT